MEAEAETVHVSTKEPALEVISGAEQIASLIEQDRIFVPHVPLSVDDRIEGLEGIEKSLSAQTVPCRRAATCLLIPISFLELHDELLEGTATLAKLLLSRTVYDVNQRREIPLWEVPVWPVQLNEFDLHFRAISGIEVSQMSDAHRFALTKGARKILFENARLWGHAGNDTVLGHAAKIKRVTLLIFPNASCLAFDIHWDASAGFTLDDLRKWTYLAKFKSTRPGVVRGWTFRSNLYRGVVAANAERLQKSLDANMYAAKFSDRPVGLGPIASWLVKLPTEQSVLSRVNIFSIARHHSFAQIEGELFVDDPEIVVLLQNIVFQDGSAHRVTSTNTRDEEDEIVLRPRSNRMIRLCSQGAFALEWGESSEFFNTFGTLFLVLTMHVVAEREMLIKLSFLAAKSGKLLGTATSVREKSDLRLSMIQIVTNLTKYNLLMNTDHCGGRPLYSEYFSSLREVFRLSDLREELREGVNDTLHLVDLDYQEDHRSALARHQKFVSQRQEVEQKIESMKANQQNVFSFIILIASALFLPFTLTSGVFGMNNSSLPVGVSWGWLLIGTGIFCVAMMLIMTIVYVCTSRISQIDELRDELRSLCVREAKANSVSGFVKIGDRVEEFSATGGALFGVVDVMRDYSVRPVAGASQNAKVQNLIRRRTNTSFPPAKSYYIPNVRGDEDEDEDGEEMLEEAFKGTTVDL